MGGYKLTKRIHIIKSTFSRKGIIFLDICAKTTDRRKVLQDIVTTQQRQTTYREAYEKQNRMEMTDSTQSSKS